VQNDSWGVTARMSVDFRRPVTVGQRIRAEGRITASRRRIQVTAATIVDAETGVELATAEATYVAASDARKRELKQRYGVAEGTLP
jgi:acyl-CoA thioesterase FadM